MSIQAMDIRRRRLVLGRRASNYATYISSLNPTAYWRFNDLQSPPSSNSYDEMIVNRSDLVEYWELDDLSHPPTTNEYHDAILGRADTVAYWKLNESSGTTVANSVTGNLYPGTINGNPTLGNTGPLLGSTDTCIDLDGTGDYVALAYNPALNPASFTVAAWVYRDVDTGVVENVFVSMNSSASSQGYTLRISSTDKVEATFRSSVTVSGTTSIPTGQWVHIAVTYDGPTTTGKIYLNGALEGTNAAAILTQNTTGAAGIGGVIHTTGAFNGKIANVSLHNAALSTAEIGSLFVKGRPVAGYRNLYNGGQIDAPSSATGPCIGSADGAFDFDGSNDRVIVPYNASLNPATTLTLCAWIWRDDNGADERIASSAINNKGWYFGISSTDKLYIGLGDGAGVSTAATGATNVPTGQWSHVAVTYDGTTARVYLNGVLDGSGTDAYTANDNTQGPLQISASSTGASLFNGRISKLSLHNTAMSANDIGALFALGRPVVDSGVTGDYTATVLATSPVAHWKLDEVGGSSSLNNSAAGSYPLSGAGSPVLGSAGPFGGTSRAPDFNGSTDYLTRAYTSQLNPANEFLISAWIYRETDTGAIERIIWSHNSTKGFTLSINASDKLIATAANGTTTNTATSSSSVPTGRWVHVAASYDSSDLKVYINGVLEGTQATAYSRATAGVFRIGADDSGSNPFNGKIAHVTVRDSAAQGAEMLNWYNAGVKQMRFDGGQIDFPSSARGALSGDVDGALDFDGSNDCIQVPYRASLNQQAFSVAGWIYRDVDTGSLELVIDSRSSLNVGWNVFMLSGDKLSFRIGNGSTGIAADTTTTIATGTWYHFVGTYDGANAKIYLNGALEATSAPVTISPNLSFPTTIGKQSYTTGSLWNGKIDEPAYWGGTVLDASQILAMYTKGSA